MPAIGINDEVRNKIVRQLLNLGFAGVGILLLFAGYYFVSRSDRYPDTAFYPIIAIIAVGLLGSIYFCLRPTASKTNFLLISTSMLLAIYIIEASLQTLDYFRSGIVTFDSRTALEVIIDSHSNGSDLWSFEIPLFRGQKINHNHGNTYALSAPSKANVITCNETGRWIIIKTDEHGFNNPPQVDKNQTTEIGLIGDSFTHGGCTPNNKNIGHYLRELGYSVRNLGVMGSGPLHHLAVLTEYGSHYKPKTVIWFFYEGNDLADIIKEKRFSLLNKYKKSGFSGHLVNKQKAVDKHLFEYQKAMINKNIGFWGGSQELDVFWKFFKLETVRRILGLTGYQIDVQLIKNNISFIQSEFNAIAKAMKSTTESWGGKLIFVYLPDATRFDRLNRFRFWKKEISKILQELDIPFWDYHQALDADSDPLASYNLRRPNHFSAHGNKVLANYLKKKLD